MKYLTDFDSEQIEKLVLDLGEKKFRVQQLLDGIYKNHLSNIDIISNIPKEFKEKLKKEYSIYSMRELQVKRSQTDNVRKILWELKDRLKIETVIIGGKRNTVCVSTQVGCPIKCAFCASGTIRFERNLSSGEIIEQLLRLGDIAIDNIVFMGIGEPMLNFDNVIKAVKMLGIGARKITISTVGIPEMIKKLASINMQIRLAISLHSADEEIRKKLVPGFGSLDELFDSLHYYQKQTKRLVTFECVLIDGVNDSLKDADLIVKRVKGLKSKVNLIGYNPVEFFDFKRPPEDRIIKFRDFLISRGIKSTIRKRLGSDISAACGQLAATN